MNVDNVLGDVMGGESYYDPTEDKPSVIVPEGDFYAHVKDYTVKEDVVIRGTVKRNKHPVSTV